MDYECLEEGGVSIYRYERRIKTIPTTNLVQKLLREYPVRNLNRYPEQSETDANSLILVPNRIGSDGKDDCHSGQSKPDWKTVNMDSV